MKNEKVEQKMGGGGRLQLPQNQSEWKPLAHSYIFV